MRQSGKNTRQRGRGGRRSNNVGQINRNTVLDSNGPDIRLRGNAQQLHEKYTSLGNEAAAAGERIAAEAYFQYADHYFRVHSTIMAALNEKRQQHDPRPAAPNNEGAEPNGNVAENAKNGHAPEATSATDTNAPDTNATDTNATDTNTTDTSASETNTDNP